MNEKQIDNDTFNWKDFILPVILGFVFAIVAVLLVFTFVL